MSAILPEEEQDEYPTGFSIVGHVGTLSSAETGLGVCCVNFLKHT